MSTILKALRRLEDNRGVEEERPLRESVAAGSADASREKRRVPWLLIFGVLIAAGAAAGTVAFWSAVGDPTDEPQLATAVRPVPAPAPTRRESSRPAAAPSDTTAARVEIVRVEDAPGAGSDAFAALPSAPELPPEALESPVEMMRRTPAPPRIDASDEVEVLEPAPSAEPVQRFVRGKPLLPPGQIPGRHRGANEKNPLVVAAAGSGSVPAKSSPPSPPAPEASAESAPPPTVDWTPPKIEPTPPSTQVGSTSGSESGAAPSPGSRAPRAAPTPRASTLPPAPVPEREPPKPVAPTPAPKAAPAPTPKPEPTVAKSPPKPEPTPAKAPPPTSQAAPSIAVAGTSWHPSPERRTASVALDDGTPVEVQEGDRVGDLTVSRIEPSSVVFLHEGKELRRRVGER